MRVKGIILLTATLIITVFATGHGDSIPPFQYDAGVQARLAGDPLNGICEINNGLWPDFTVTDAKLYYSTDGQVTWNNVAAANTVDDRYEATTPGIAGNAHWRFYIQTDSCWGGQTAFYGGSSNCRLPENWYIYWTDNVGLDSMDNIPGGVGDWMDIRGAGFCVSEGRFYGKMVMATDEFRLDDGDYSSVLQLYDHNYGYMFAINNPMEPTGTVVYAMVHCNELDPPDMEGHVEFAPGVLKVFDTDPQEIYVIDDAIEFEFVAETMFVSCPITSITGDPDYGTYPNDARYWTIQANVMHLYWTGTWYSPNVVSYFPDETIYGHAYYNHNGTDLDGWLSSPTAPNTPPLLSSPSVVYADGPDQTTITVTYSDADENSPEYVRVEIAATRDVHELSKAEVVGPHGWMDGVQYSTVIPGYHGFGAEFTFSASDGADTYNLPAGPLAVEGIVPNTKSIDIWPNPFNSGCAIHIPGSAKMEIYDMNGRIIEEIQSTQPQTYYWQPSTDLSTGVYLIKVAHDGKIQTERIVYMK